LATEGDAYFCEPSALAAWIKRKHQKAAPYLPHGIAQPGQLSAMQDSSMSGREKTLLY
jgi:hypothetical protein